MNTSFLLSVNSSRPLIPLSPIGQCRLNGDSCTLELSDETIAHFPTHFAVFFVTLNPVDHTLIYEGLAIVNIRCGIKQFPVKSPLHSTIGSITFFQTEDEDDAFEVLFVSEENKKTCAFYMRSGAEQLASASAPANRPTDSDDSEETRVSINVPKIDKLTRALPEALYHIMLPERQFINDGVAASCRRIYAPMFGAVLPTWTLLSSFAFANYLRYGKRSQSFLSDTQVYNAISAASKLINVPGNQPGHVLAMTLQLLSCFIKPVPDRVSGKNGSIIGCDVWIDAHTPLSTGQNMLQGDNEDLAMSLMNSFLGLSECLRHDSSTLPCVFQYCPFFFDGADSKFSLSKIHQGSSLQLTVVLVPWSIVIEHWCQSVPWLQSQLKMFAAGKSSARTWFPEAFSSALFDSSKQSNELPILFLEPGMWMTQPVPSTAARSNAAVLQNYRSICQEIDSNCRSPVVQNSYRLLRQQTVDEIDAAFAGFGCAYSPLLTQWFGVFGMCLSANPTTLGVTVKQLLDPIKSKDIRLHLHSKTILAKPMLDKIGDLFYGLFPSLTLFGPTESHKRDHEIKTSVSARADALREAARMLPTALSVDSKEAEDTDSAVISRNPAIMLPMDLFRVSSSTLLLSSGSIRLKMAALWTKLQVVNSSINALTLPSQRSIAIMSISSQSMAGAVTHVPLEVENVIRPVV